MLHLVNLEKSLFEDEAYHTVGSSLRVLLCNLVEAGKTNSYNCSSEDEIDNLLQGDDL